ncbi:competence/damage-inducible protein A [bacterium]|nr:competence/damage-inducible protein A [bacterium]
MDPKAAILIIGDEILSGYTTDANSGWLAKQLFDLGIEVRLIVTIPDEKGAIIKWVQELFKKYDYVFTTGGIGPTHDDITRQSVAESFNLPFVIHPEAEKIMRDFYGSRITESRLSMAYLPENAALIRNPLSAAPGFIIKNVYVFPGIPELLKLMFPQIVDNFNFSRFITKIIKTQLPESVYARDLFQAVDKFPSVLIGSYPKVFDTECKTQIVLKSKSEADLKEAYEYIQSFINELQKENLK